MHSESLPVEIFGFSESDLFQSLSNKRCPSTEVEKQDRARYLFSYLSKLQAKTIVVEHDYIDRDYLEDFASYYARCFRQYDRHCKRLHFFKCPLNPEKFLELVRDETPPEEGTRIRDAYLGFVVARPLPDAIVGRTILATYDSDGGRRNYPCTLQYDANLFGVALSVQSLAFQEQDTVLAACATVSLWCCFHKTKQLFGSPAPTPAEITRLANQVVHHSRPVPSHGLIVEQICNAIRQAGLEPEVIQVKPHTPLTSLIYGHLKMGLPVILGVDVEGKSGHAITLVGYSLKEERVLIQEVATGNWGLIPSMTGLHIDKFYAHDDQIGPFSRVEVKPSTKVGKVIYPVTFQGAWVDKQTGKLLTLYPHVLIIPVYNKIRLSFADIQAWITRLTYVLSSLFGPEAPLEWDVYLTTTNEYKKFIKNSQQHRGKVLEGLILEQHPRFIWRATLKFDRTDILELLFDATDMARSLPVYHAQWYNQELRNLLNGLLKRSELQNRIIPFLTRPFLEFLIETTE